MLTSSSRKSNGERTKVLIEDAVRCFNILCCCVCVAFTTAIYSALLTIKVVFTSILVRRNFIIFKDFKKSLIPGATNGCRTTTYYVQVYFCLIFTALFNTVKLLLLLRTAVNERVREQG